MEDLNNRQIVLLTMLVSFVVSIATGIITVAMLQEAPPTLTQTVNRVVEHTIERVVTGTSTPATVTNVTKEVTVFAKEDDLVVSAVEKNQPRMVALYSPLTGTSSDPFAVGFVASRDGYIVIDRVSIDSGSSLETKYPVLIGGKEYTATPVSGVSGENKSPLVFLKINDLEKNGVDAATFGRTENPKPGQTVVVLGGSDGTGIFKTTLSKLRFVRSNSTTTPEQILSGVETLPKIPEQYRGGLVVNLDGQAVGIVIPDPSNSLSSIVYPVSRILELLGAIPAKSAKDTPPVPSPAT